MGTEQDEEYDEVLEEYARQYLLDTGLPNRIRKQAIFLIKTIRSMRRLQFDDRKRALAAYAKAERWLGESKVFHATDHAGYNRLLEDASASLAAIGERIDEKFPAP